MDWWVANEWAYNRKATYTYADAKSKHFGGQANELVDRVLHVVNSKSVEAHIFVRR
jgi:hypothetical protein